MTSERIGPIQPDSGKNQPPRTEAGRRSFQKIEKVEEVDPDENRARQFQKALDDAEDLLQNAIKSPPTPFDTFTTTFNQPTSRPRQSALPPPPSPPPPSRNFSPSQKPQDEEDDDETSPLPKSDTFWKKTDEPPDQPLKKPDFKEKKEKEAPSKKQEKKGSFSPFAVSEEEKKTKENTSFSAIKPPKPSTRDKKGEMLFPEEKKGKSFPPSIPPPSNKEKKSSPLKKEKEESMSPFAPTTSQPPPSSAKGGREFQGDDKRKNREVVELPSTTPLPPAAIAVAQAAVIPAMPYLSPAVLPLFAQMVGTIQGMLVKGVSQVEIVLNSPNFVNSKFYGTTILIEKYSTAPDSLNIRLTGNQEAVTAFNQSIPSLMAAFQNGNFAFRIHRIDTAYATDRPLFRRKGPKLGGGDAGGKENT